MVGVAADGAALVLLDAVLVDDPFEGAAVGEAVIEDLGLDADEIVGSSVREAPAALRIEKTSDTGRNLIKFA